MSIDSLKELYEEQIKDLHSAEKQIIEALTKLTQAATSSELKKAFRDHQKETREQKKRLERIMKQHGFEEAEEECKAMKGLVEEGEELIEKGLDEDVADAALIVAAQKVEHYEIASYGALKVYAKQLGHREDAQLLDETLKEEKKADKLLNEIAREANRRAQDSLQAQEEEESEQETATSRRSSGKSSSKGSSRSTARQSSSSGKGASGSRRSGGRSQRAS